MAEEDEAGLVDFEEIPDVSYDPRSDLSSFPPEDELTTSGGNFSFLHSSGRTSDEQQRTVPDLILAVYVVHFDTRRGNTHGFFFPQHPTIFKTFLFSGSPMIRQIVNITLKQVTECYL